MGSMLESLYPMAPVWAQNLGISVYGIGWRRERLGGRFSEHVKAFQDRDRCSPEDFNAHIEAQLRTVLELAFREVPYYARTWRAAGLVAGDFQQFKLADLARLPTTPKDHLRSNAEQFVAESARHTGSLNRYFSSGTTGTPVTAICTPDGHRRFIAAREVRSFGWAGTSIQKKRSMIGGRLVVSKGDAKPPFHRYNWSEAQVYFSAYHISPANVSHYVDAINKYRPWVFTGYAYSHFLLARMMQEMGLSIDYQPDALVLGSEKLTSEMKAVIKTVFRARAYEEYGCVENCVLATECEHGRLHVSPDFGIVEIVDENGVPVGPGIEGRIVCTSLLNEAQPLIRYEIGDMGAWSAEVCPCGRNHLPILKELSGRMEDIITGPDGRQLVRFHGIFVGLKEVLQGQIVQESRDAFTVKVVALPSFGESDVKTICERMQQRLGKVNVTVVKVPEIPGTSRGKFRAVISLVDEQGSSSKPPQPITSQPTRGNSAVLLNLFHKLPPFARDLAASLHGYSLKASRYSPQTAAKAREIVGRDFWPSSAWKAWTDDRLESVLKRAALDVPYYRQMWEERRKNGDNTPFESLANWPVLKKKVLRKNSERFVASDCDRNKMMSTQTSGTTGTPLTLWRTKETLQQWYALFEARIRLWNGFDFQTRWGHVGGQPVVPFKQNRPPYWVWNAGLNQLYLSSMHIGPKSSAAYLEAIKKYRLEYLLGYASSISMLAQAALEQGVMVPLKLVITDSEPLLEQQRRTIELAFGCPVRETYGMAEIACAASECSAGKLHLWPEVGIIELLDQNDQPVAPGETGRIITTQLLNMDMPLIRYDTQDLAQLETDDAPCACGRTLPRIKKLVGRNDDVVIARDGRRLVQIDRIFGAEFDIKEAQIVQEAIGRFTIRIVPGARWTQANEAPLCAALRDLVGEAEITVEMVQKIEKTWAGKHRMIVSKVDSSTDKVSLS